MLRTNSSPLFICGTHEPRVESATKINNVMTLMYGQRKEIADLRSNGWERGQGFDMEKVGEWEGCRTDARRKRDKHADEWIRGCWWVNGIWHSDRRKNIGGKIDSNGGRIDKR